MSTCNKTMYINGVKRLVSNVGTSFYADSDELPERPCSHHTLKAISVLQLEQGGRVFTSGNWYSLHPDKQPTT